MAYYNPNRTQDNYYNPYDNARNDASPMQQAGQMLKSLALIGGLNLIGSAVTHRLASGANRVMKSWMRKPFGIRRQVAQRAYKATRVLSRSKNNIKQSLKRTSYGKAYQARIERLRGLKGKSGYGAARFTSAFRNPKTLIASAASVWKKNVFDGMGVAYAVDSLLGITRDLGLEQKKWYDVPGHISNFGKWMIQDTIAGMAFGGASRSLGAMGSASLKGAQRAFGGNFGKRLLEKLSSNSPTLPPDARYQKFLSKSVLAQLPSEHQRKFAAGVVQKALHFSERVQDSYRSLQSALYTTPDAIKTGLKSRGLTFGERTKKAFSTIQAAIDNTREIAIRDRNTPTAATTRYGGLRALEALDTLAKSKLSPAENNLPTNALEKHFIPELKRQSDQESFLGKTFGFLKHVRNRDIVDEEWVNRTSTALQSKFGKSRAEMLLKNVLDMKAGSNLYRDWSGSKMHGAGVDLTAFDPIHTMRRSASWIANKRFHIPLTSMNFTLAELTGTTRYLSDSPSFEFFKGKPEFQYGDGSIGDLARSDDALFMYTNKRWAIFDGEGIQEVNSHRKLYYSPKTGRDKSYELKSITINRLRQAAETTGHDFNKIAQEVEHRQDIGQNKFLRFLDRRNLGLPTKFGDMLGSITARLKGKKHYDKMFTEMFGDSTANFDEAYRNLPVIDNVLTHTSQVFSRVLQNKNALQHIAHFVNDTKLRDDIIGAAYDDQTLINALDNLDWRAGDWAKRTGFKRAVEELKAFPKEARTHKTVKRLGPMSDMTARDVARTNYIDDIFNKNYLNETPTPGTSHPIIAAVPGLLEKGMITPKEAQALNLHAKLSVFRDMGLTRNIATPDQFGNVLKKIRSRAKDEQWDVTRELIDFVSNNKIKPPRTDFEQQRILNQFLAGADLGSAKRSGGTSPYFSAPEGIAQMTDILGRAMDSTTDMLSEWLPFKKRFITHHGLAGGARFVAGAVGTTAMAFGAYRVADTLIASNPLFDNTALDEGLTGFGADQLARGRMALARGADIVGYTGMMKYMHGLAPGSETTLPGMVAGGIASAAMGASPVGIGTWMLRGAVMNRLASPYMPDMTKSHEELEEIYSGRAQVPMMKSPTWILGGTPWEGSKVVGWTPNWYVRAKSRWKETDTVYGSAFRKLIHEPLPFLGWNVGDLIDPYYMERKHFFSRPYPVTGGVFDEMPIIGKPLSATIGRLIKPPKTMHQEFLTSDQIQTGQPGDPYPFALRPPTLGEGLGMMKNQSPVRSMGGQATAGGGITTLPTKQWSETAAEDFLYDISHFAGLRGFLGGTIAERVFGQPTVMPTLQTAGRIASMSRSFYDMNLGGMGVLTEPIRRLIDKPEYRQYGVNPIPNQMPNWLPSHFLTGDPYEKILRGELRLPGEAYSKTHTGLRRTMPARACFTPDTLIDTSVGLTPIVDAIDTMTSDGSYQKIEKLFERQYEGDMLEIATDNIDPKYNIKVTPNHDIFGIKINKCRYYKTQSKYRRGCFKCNDKRKSICTKKLVSDEYNIQEHKARDLEVGDYLVSPITPITDEFKYIDLKDLFINKESYIVRENKLLNGNNIQITDKLQCTKKLMSLIGFYLAEGSVSKYQVTFSFNSNEIDYINEVKDFGETIFNCTSTTVFSNRSNSAHITLNSKLARDFFLYFCGKTKTKFINTSIWNFGEQNILYLLSSYFKGDGWCSCNEVGSVSCIENLSFSIFKLLCSLGFKPSISHRLGKNSFFKKENRHIKSTKRFDIRVYWKYAKQLANKLGFQNDDINIESFIYNGFIPFKIKSIKKAHYSGKVYDLNVRNNHNYTVPFMLVHNSMLGGTEEHILQYFTGSMPPMLREQYDIVNEGNEFHEAIQDSLAAEGLLVQAEAFVADVKNNVTGHVDAIIRDGKGGRGRRALEIKSISQEGFEKLDGPKYQHVGQLNFYLNQLNMRKGSILYVSRDNPSNVKVFEVNYSQSRLEKDFHKLRKAREAAQSMLETGVADDYGYSYSWLDRLDILADVAPTSSEYKEAKVVVEKQIKMGVLTDKEITKYKYSLKKRQARLRKYELYPNRFKGKLFSPDTEKNIQSINEDIKAGADYSLPERAIGWAWEGLTNTNFFPINKLWGFKDPVEHYKMTRLYGKEYKPWDEPIRAWIEPYSRGLASKTNPLEGGISYGMGGMVLGGPLGSVIGAGFGAAYGTVHGLYRFATNSTYIPQNVEEKREISAYFDAAKYAKADMLANLTSGMTQKKFVDARSATLASITRHGGSVADLFRATPFMEKPYIESFLNTRNPKERQEILSIVPKDLGSALKQQWHKHDEQEGTEAFVDATSQDIAGGSRRLAFNRSVLDPGTRLEDIQLKTIEERGFDVHEFGLGWNEQMLRMQMANNSVQSANIEEEAQIPTPNLSSGHIRGVINNLFRQHGINARSMVYINNGANDVNTVNITVRKDRSRAVIEALNNRKRFNL